MHTPLPWSACKDGNCRCGYIFGADDEVYVAKAIGEGDDVDPYPHAEQQRENVKLIIRAVNSHEALLEALTLLYKLHADGVFSLPDAHYRAITMAATAIAKAEGQEAPNAHQG